MTYERRISPYIALAIFFFLAVALNMLGREYFVGLGEGRGWDRVLSNPLSVFNKFSPSIAGLLCIGWFFGRQALKDLFRNFFKLGCDTKILVFAVLYPFLAMLVALFLYCVVSGERPQINPDTSLVGLLAAAGYQFSLRTLAGGGLGEEIGWRAFAMPLIMPRLGPAWTTLIVGVLWSAWHWPGILATDSGLFEIFDHLYLTILITIAFTYFYLRSGGSVLVAVLLHGALNGFFTFGAKNLAPALNISDNWQPYFDWVFISGGLIMAAHHYWTRRNGFDHTGA